MEYLTKVFHKLNDYPLPIINAIAQQELNDSQNKKKKAESSKASDKIQLILAYSRK